MKHPIGTRVENIKKHGPYFKVKGTITEIIYLNYSNITRIHYKIVYDGRPTHGIYNEWEFEKYLRVINPLGYIPSEEIRL